MVNIIPFSNEYLDSLLVLENICFTIPWTKEMFIEEFKSNITYYLIAVEDGRVIGYAGLWKVLDEGQITNIAVMPDYRRQGIALQLLTELVNSTKDLGIISYTLEVRESNIPAQKLYEKIGFKKLAQEKTIMQITEKVQPLMEIKV